MDLPVDETRAGVLDSHSWIRQVHGARGADY